MLREQSLCKGVVCLTAAIALLSVGTEWAVARGGGGGHGGGSRGGFSRGGFSGGGYGGYGYGRGYGGYGYGGYGYGRGFGGYGYGPGYSSYYDYGYAVPTPVYVNPVAVVPRMPPAAAPGNTAVIDVFLPQADAKVWVDGNAITGGSGTQRSFTSPALEPGYSYSYRVTAAWLESGQEVRLERTVQIAPGRASAVDFTRANPSPHMAPARN